MRPDAIIKTLEDAGFEARYVGGCVRDTAENIEGADCLIRTAAAHNDNPEIAAARARGVPIFERAQAWGYIMRAYKNAICVSGTHGLPGRGRQISGTTAPRPEDP